MRLNLKSVVIALSLVILAAVPLYAQTPIPDQPASARPGRNFGGDPIRQLNLTAEQREQIRIIREQSRDERATINQRVRETNRALEEALDSDNPNQSVLEERIQELSLAQAEAMRMRIKTEVKIRQVLTSEQRIMLKEMRQNVHQLRYRRREDGNIERERRLEQRTRRLERRRNQVRPISQGNESRPPQEF